MPPLSSQLLAPLLLLLLPLASYSSVLNYKLAHSLQGRAVAYADFNADTLVDTFVVEDGGRQVSVLLAGKDNAVPTRRPLFLLPPGRQLVSLSVADFNGDSRADLLVTHSAGKGSLSVSVGYATGGRKNVTEPTLVVANADTEPALYDSNADMIADFLVYVNSAWTAFVGQSGENRFRNTTSPFLASHKMLPYRPGGVGSLFVDLNGDLRADLLVPVQSADSLATVARRTDSGFAVSDDIPLPKESGGGVGQPTSVNLNNDEFADLALPVCTGGGSGGSCDASKLHVLLGGGGAEKEWRLAKVEAFEKKSHSWVPPSANPLQSQPIQLRPGDLDSDGRLDLLVTVLRLSDKKLVPAYLTLISQPASGSYQFTLTELPIACPDSHNRLALTAFADVNQDGGLDLLLLCASAESPAKFLSVQHSLVYNEEGYFFRVMVLSGKCSGKYNCPDYTLPVGLPVPGPCAKFTTEKPEGGIMIGIGCQLTQSARSQLDLPFMHFGLGQFSNYIDRLTVAIPYANSEKKRQHESTFIIPNSQLVIIPYPNDQPASWSSELFVKPFYDKQVLYVGVTLLGTCLVACIVAAVFQCREYREDKLERVAGQQGVVFDPISGR